MDEWDVELVSQWSVCDKSRALQKLCVHFEWYHIVLHDPVWCHLLIAIDFACFQLKLRINDISDCNLLLEYSALCRGIATRIQVRLFLLDF